MTNNVFTIKSGVPIPEKKTFAENRTPRAKSPLRQAIMRLEVGEMLEAIPDDSKKTKGRAAISVIVMNVSKQEGKGRKFVTRSIGTKEEPKVGIWRTA